MKSFLRETDEFFAEHMPTVTRRLFYLCLASFLVLSLLKLVLGGTEFGPALLRRIFTLVPNQAVLQLNVWQFLTFPFTHADFWHLFGNLLTLFFFGRLIEEQMGSRRYGWFLMIACIVGGILHTIIAFAMGKSAVGLIGFSGACFALITAAVIWFPHVRVLFMFIVPMPLRVMALILGVIIGLDIFRSFLVFGPLGDGVSHIAHLAGVLVGIVLIKNPSLLNFVEDLHVPGVTRRRPRKVRGRMGMGHPGRHSDPDDRYNDPHWRLDQ